MNKKIFVIIGILVVVVILLFPRVIALNDGGTKIYKSLVYEVTKVHKIKANSLNEFNEGTIVKIFGKEVYNNVPKDVEVIADGKEKEKLGTTYEKNIDGVTLMLEIPKEWRYTELSRNNENDFYKYALKIYKTQEDKYAVLYFYHQMFGVCGTGRTSKQIDLNNGNKATIGYYDGKDIWQDISFFETNKYIAIINYGLDKSESEEVIDFVKTINIIENSDKTENLSMENEYEFIAEIIEAKEKSIIVKPDANSKEIKSCDKISIGITRPTNGTNDFYVVGNKVKITYNGIIMESYPAQIIATKIELAN